MRIVIQRKDFYKEIAIEGVQFIVEVSFI